MFEITGNHIAELRDGDLRDLVAKLCEAELRAAGLPISAVTAGGAQDAPDGGLDVRVSLPAGTRIAGYVPKAATGFQVKVPDMPRGEILEEMRPGGVMRPAIRELALQGGAYIIVSAHSSTADSALRHRIAAMQEALEGLVVANPLHVDFYDRGRVATWVRQHLGLAPWVRGKIGRSIAGWRGFENWAAPSEPAGAEYLADAQSRVLDGRQDSVAGLSIEDGVVRIRDILAQPRGVVRLVGLSGTGKTRLAQALFDARVGVRALPQEQAAYTDLGFGPRPHPRELIRELSQNEQRAIVVVDNCPPEVHRDLAAAARAEGCTVSLITIEYDVGDDQPEGTEVFRLEAASADVIVRLIERRCPDVSQVDRRHIAELSGGNAKIALALAQTVRHGESVADLSDRELFERLFHQRRPQDAELLRAAEALSLVYSFQGEALDGRDAELPVLGALVGLTATQMYEQVAELRARNLVQHRSEWRAVLPHALANHLAGRALDRIPSQRVTELMDAQASERLLRSFSRRLQYLHDNASAQSIVRRWLQPDQRLGSLGSYSELQIAMLRNVAPVVPDVVLDVIERTISGEGREDLINAESRHRARWILLLKALAYESHHFTRSALLLAQFVQAEPASHNVHSARNPFKELFHLHLSGTQAPPDVRLDVTEELLGDSENHQALECGLTALSEMLEAWHFTSSQTFEFGGRPRSFGWSPSTRMDLISWFAPALQRVQRLAVEPGPLHEKARAVLANRFRGLWTKAGLYDELEGVVRVVADREFWGSGWTAVRSTLQFDASAMPAAPQERLRALEELLRPVDPATRARVYVLSRSGAEMDVADGEPIEEGQGPGSGWERAERTAELLGSELAADLTVLTTLLPDFLRGDVTRGWAFGRGLAAAPNYLEVWARVIAALANVPPEERNIQVLRGFLHYADTIDAAWVGQVLDAAIENPILGPLFPLLQTAIDVREVGARRLAAALGASRARIHLYGQLMYGRATESIPSDALADLLRRIAALPEGYQVAVEILRMRLFGSRQGGLPEGPGLLQVGRDLVRQLPFEHDQHMLDHQIGDIAAASFRGVDAEGDTVALCRTLVSAIQGYQTSTYAHAELFVTLFRIQPSIALDELLLSGVLRGGRDDHNNPLKPVPRDQLIAWAQRDFDVRLVALAGVVPLFENSTEKGPLQWSALALEILELAPDRRAVLNEFSTRLYPTTSWGSFAEAIEGHSAAVGALMAHADPVVVAWARERQATLQRAIENERAREARRDETFE